MGQVRAEAVEHGRGVGKPMGHEAVSGDSTAWHACVRGKLRHRNHGQGKDSRNLARATDFGRAHLIDFA